MLRRRTLPPIPSPLDPTLHATRRRSARHETSERVRLSLGDRDVPGWMLNVSAGGVRAVVEEPLELGAEVRVAVGAAPSRPGRVVWAQDELDGSIIGVCFLDQPAPRPG